jgi:DNA-binding transcriptional MerR regulator
MRIGELSACSGVAVPTIKYYLRERLLEPGVARAANQADYSEDHLRQLLLVRALIDVGGVPVAAARDVITALGRDQLNPHELLGAAHEAVAPHRRPDRDSDAWRDARQRAGAFVSARGWRVHPEATALDQLADVLAALTALQVTEVLDSLDGYAHAAAQLADLEVANVVARKDPARMLELVALGTVLGEALFSALRLLAHENASAEQFGVMG